MLYESDVYLECLTGFFKYVLVVGQKGIDPPECFSQEILMNNLKASLVDMFSPKVQKYVECEVVCLKDELQSDRTLRRCTRRRNSQSCNGGAASTTAMVCYAVGGGGVGELVA